MRKLLSKFLTIFLCLDLLFTSFYPFFAFPALVGAQEEGGEDLSSWDLAWSAIPDAETAPAEAPQEQVDSCLMYGEGCQYTVPDYEAPPIAEPIPEPTPEPMPPSCGEPQFQYNQCTGCRSSQAAFQDSCGNWSTGGEQYEASCTDACPAEVPAPTPEPTPEPTPLCTPDCSGVWVHCSGEIYDDGCGGSCTGTFSGSCDDPAALSVCTTETYTGTCGRTCNGLNDCTYRAPEPVPEPIFEPSPEPVMYSPEPVYTPEPVMPMPTPDIGQQQIDFCLQYGEGCGVVSQPITDSSSQDQAVSGYWQDYDQTYATTTNNEYIAAEVREEDAGGGVMEDIVTAPEVAAETSGNWWDGVTSFIGTQADNFGQMVTSPFTATTGYAENLNKEAEKTEQAVHDQDQQQAEDLNKAINTPTSEKLAALKEQFGLQNTPNEEAIQIIKDAYSLRGLDFNPEDGSVQKNLDDSYTPSNYSIDFNRTRNPAVSDKQIEYCLQYGEGCDNPNWTPEELAQRRQQGQDAIKEFTLNLSQIYTTGGKLLENINTVNEMQPLYDQTGMKERTQARLSSYTGSEKVPEYFTNGAFVNGTVTPQEVEDDMKANPDLGSPEKNAAREKLYELAKEKEERGKEITLEVSAAMLMTSVGGSTALSLAEKGGGKLAGRIAGKSGKDVLENEVIEDLGELAAKRATGEMEPVYVLPTQQELSKIEDSTATYLQRQFGAEIPTDVGIANALIRNGYPSDTIKDMVPVIRERLEQELPATKTKIENDLAEFMLKLKALGREVDDTSIRNNLSYSNYPEEEVDEAVSRIKEQISLSGEARINQASQKVIEEFGNFGDLDEESVRYILKEKGYSEDEAKGIAEIIQARRSGTETVMSGQDVETIVAQTLGREGTPEEIVQVTKWMGEKGLSREDVIAALERAKVYSKFVKSAYTETGRGYYTVNGAPTALHSSTTLLNYHYKGPPADLMEDIDSHILGVTEAILTQRTNAARITPLIDRSKKSLEALKEAALRRGVNKDIVERIDIDELLDSANIQLLSGKQMTEKGVSGAGGYYYKADGQIVIRKGILGEPDSTLTHEALHKSHDIYHGGMTDPLEDLGYYSYEGAGGKLEEGVTEYMSQQASKEQGRYLTYAKQSYGGYMANVASIEREIIPALLQSGLTKQEAERLIWEVGLSGDYPKLMQAVGGAEKMKQILDKVPRVQGDILRRHLYARHPLDIATAIALVAEGGYAGYKGAEFLQDRFSPPKMLPWRLVSNVYADESNVSEATAVSTKDFEKQVKLELVKNILRSKRKIDSQTVREILQTEIFTPEIYETAHGYIFQTGEAGSVEGQLEQATYKILINPVPGVDIEAPELIDLNNESSAVVAIKIKKGSGKVQKVASRASQKLIGIVYATDDEEELSNLAQIKVILANEKGEVLPWAGVKVNLEKVNQENTINLKAGWNLVSLDALPGKSLTASLMLDIVSGEGGMASAVSTLENGAWKTFVSRGSKDYSGEDFLIEPGKAYFVKALKPSKFTFAGQNFVEPVKLKLSSGWNAVGLPVLSKKPKTQYKVSELLDDLNAEQAEADTAAQWDSGLWDTFVKKNQQEYGENFSILPGAGYILKVGKEGEFSP